MNEMTAQSKETKPHIRPLLGKSSKDALGRGARGELEPRPCLPPAFPSTRFAQRAACRPGCLPSSSGRSLPLRAGVPAAPAEGTGSRGDPLGHGAGAAATEGPKALESLLGVSPARAAGPPGKQLSGSFPRPRPRGRSRRRCSTAGARAAKDGPARRGRVSRPLGPGAALRVYPARGRSPRPPPCAPLTSFVLSHPRPPPPFPNSDSPAGPVAAAPAPAAVALGARSEARKTGATS